MHIKFITILAIIGHLIFATDSLSSNLTCGNNAPAQQLATLIKSHDQQQRKNLDCNEKLTEIALIKAGHIIESQDVWHNAGRMAPNQLLRHHGFKLPKTYPLFGNQVEALAGGEQVVELVFSDFLNSEPHRKLLLGDDLFFSQQDQIGVAYVEDLTTDHQHFWVVIIADEKNTEIKQEPVIEVKPPVFAPKKRNRGREIKERLYRNKVKETKRF